MSSEQLDEESARKILTSGWGKTIHKLVYSCTVPLCWFVSKERGSKYKARNGSAFFLDAGEGPFGVTAAHVISDLQQAMQNDDPVEEIKLLNLAFDMEKKNQIIDIDENIDIATFKITSDEIKSVGKIAITGSNRSWPPTPPQQGRGIFLAGFPGSETTSRRISDFCFGAKTINGTADSISEKDISIQINREELIDILGQGLPIRNYNFGGMSGGPMLALIDGPVQTWVFAGVVYEGPNPSFDRDNSISDFEIIRARRAHFILPNGKLDINRWNEIY